jgi:SAM-dependent methyltransferase
MTDSLENELNKYAQFAMQLEGWVLEFQPEELGPGLPWNYEQRARELATGCGMLLDLGTGGGEVLSRILDGSKCNAFAIEEWHVNAPVAARYLGHSANVVRACSMRPPFPANKFDIVLSRHEAIDPKEIKRILAPSGRFLTQQVIPDYLHELSATFPDMTRYPNHFREYQDGFIEAGLTIEYAHEYRQSIRFRELGHLVYNLVAAPWAIPNFSVDSHMEGLLKLDYQIRNGQELLFTSGNYIMEVSRGI